MSLRVLMFGWEFPPYKSGGLGTACYDLTKGLAEIGTKVTFVMPIAPEGAKAKFVKLIGANAKHIKIKKIKSTMTAYASSESYEAAYGQFGNTVYGKNLFEEVERYAKVAAEFAKEPHDVIHVHDWMTYKAGMNAKKKSKKPLIAHIHATEFDRTGGNPNPYISQIEYEGMMAADKVIANSEYTKQNVMRAYKIPAGKIEVVHWGIDDIPKSSCVKPFKDKTVLFLGRITIQKGPDYFIETAGKVLKYEPKTKFIIVGSGDMMPRMIDRAAELGLSNNIIFTGVLQGKAVHDAFASADLYVMPSVSEPFGLVALESLKQGTPIMISKQSGVSEVVKHALKVDFWDTDEMANKIVNVLRSKALYNELKQNGTKEGERFNIIEPAEKVNEIYKKVIG